MLGRARTFASIRKRSPNRSRGDCRYLCVVLGGTPRAIESLRGGRLFFLILCRAPNANNKYYLIICIRLRVIKNTDVVFQLCIQLIDEYRHNEVLRESSHVRVSLHYFRTNEVYENFKIFQKKYGWNFENANNFHRTAYYLSNFCLYCSCTCLVSTNVDYLFFFLLTFSTNSCIIIKAAQATWRRSLVI